MIPSNKSRTFPFESRKNNAAIALNPDSNGLVSVDEDGRALPVNFRRRIVLHHSRFHKPVKSINSLQMRSSSHFHTKTFSGHRDIVVNTYFFANGKIVRLTYYSLKAKPPEEMNSDDSLNFITSSSALDDSIAHKCWRVRKRNYFKQPGTRIVCSTFHRPSNLRQN
ncbi:uncharacterized protein LAESUDRAFT_757728 [Laetiporus sulphureus 93-53]|uniref:Uncharacterized protein n=1 Tax=Laetiporus sulphureus 93-53 TaxID=1314785 RepID=A0A165F6K1_9APHY|nr:uncharacterized protein LAESUDRAFT_757728 [Laetiporus sulphureus 93-53]KZT08492.1 hypothetical protein LAESUDRAFT_757728 [Laetiporus sulphureus 93-53]